MKNEKNKKGIVKKVIDDMKENARKQHEIDKENFEAVKADSKARFEEAKKPTPEFQEFKDAKGLKAKTKVVMKHASENGKKIAEENREKQRELLKEQRENINKHAKIKKEG